MSVATLQAAAGPLWPYLVVIVVGFLPTEMWRVLAVWLSRDLKADSDLLLWVRLVATALLAAVVARIVVAPTGAMLAIPFVARVGGVAAALLLLMVFRRSVVSAVLLGEAIIITAVVLNG